MSGNLYDDASSLYGDRFNYGNRFILEESDMVGQNGQDGQDGADGEDGASMVSVWRRSIEEPHLPKEEDFSATGNQLNNVTNGWSRTIESGEGDLWGIILSIEHSKVTIVGGITYPESHIWFSGRR